MTSNKLVKYTINNNLSQWPLLNGHYEARGIDIGLNKSTLKVQVMVYERIRVFGQISFYRPNRESRSIRALSFC